jgi:hypothetical protein
VAVVLSVEEFERLKALAGGAANIVSALAGSVEEQSDRGEVSKTLEKWNPNRG